MHALGILVVELDFWAVVSVVHVRGEEYWVHCSFGR